jgi:hypothetical protein
MNKEITKITDLIKINFDEAVNQTKNLSEEDRSQLLLYVIDNLYDYEEDEKEDFKKNKKVIKFCRQFLDEMTNHLKDLKQLTREDYFKKYPGVMGDYKEWVTCHSFRRFKFSIISFLNIFFTFGYAHFMFISLSYSSTSCSGVIAVSLKKFDSINVAKEINNSFRLITICSSVITCFEFLYFWYSSIFDLNNLYKKNSVSIVSISPTNPSSTDGLASI